VRIGVEITLAQVVVRVNCTVGEIVDVGALSMARAGVRASGSLACLAFEAGEALAVTSITVANTFSRALSILMVVTKFVRSVNPSKLIWANTLRAVTAVVGQAKTPIVIASANSVDIASTMSRASIIALGTDGGEESNENKN